MTDTSESSAPSIEPLKNGPLKVAGLTTFRNALGEEIAVKKTMYLCRCGGSKNKPFCDGSHAKIGFSGDNSAEQTADKLESYEGREVTIRDNRAVCCHAGVCTSELTTVWRSGGEPWIDPNGAAKDEIVQTIRRCPSGALSYWADGELHTDYHAAPEITVARDGPYEVRGGVALDGVEFGAGVGREHFTLCRCGQSRNKPFCDGGHWHAGFKDG